MGITTPAPADEFVTFIQHQLPGLEDGSYQLTISQHVTLDPVTGVLGDLFPAAAYGASTLGATYSYFTGASDTSGLESGAAVTDPVQTIDVPLALFTDIAPTLADLNVSAHVLQVSVENKPMALGGQPPADPIGTFAIVIGNRLPQPDKLSHATRPPGGSGATLQASLRGDLSQYLAARRTAEHISAVSLRVTYPAPGQLSTWPSARPVTPAGRRYPPARYGRSAATPRPSPR